jgi:hypothetical protein
MMETMVTTRHWLIAVLLMVSASAHCETMKLTTEVPKCRMPASKVLPDKYYKLAGAFKEYRWVSKVGAEAHVIDEKGLGRAEGSSMFDWLTLYRVDLNNDGICDWYVAMSAPISTGGDKDSINTIYLGEPKGWTRIGFSGPSDKPDELGFGKSADQQESYLFGEEIAIVHDALSHTNYLLTSFSDRNVQRDRKPGYRLFVWDSAGKTLRLLDKWQPGSKAAEIYAFFKAHGAQQPSDKTASDELQKFDPDVEAYELAEACSADKSPQTPSGLVSPHLLAHCKR